MATGKRAELSSSDDGSNKKPRALPTDDRLPDDWIFGPAREKSEMCQLLRSLDWSKTSLGPLSSWPMCVKSALSMCVTSKFGIVIWLGPEYICVYNDAFMAYCGNKHPSNLGKPGSVYWAEMWHLLSPLLESVYKTGEPTWMVDHLLPSLRHGYVEETYWTYSYSPILSPEGKVEGVFTATYETTGRVVSERRLTTLREVSASLSGVESVAQVCRVTAQTMDRNHADVPFLALYVMSAKDKILRCESSVALTPGSSDAWPAELNVENYSEHQLVNMMQRSTLTICDLDAEQQKSIGALQPWDDTPRKVGFFPLRTHEASDEGSQGVLVMGLNTRRPVDDDFRAFLSLLGTQVASSLFNARAAEEEKSRAAALAELDRAKTTFFNNISHEFRTPLTLMLGPLEELLYNPSSSNLTEAQRLSLSLVHRNSTRLLKLVNMLLDFSRIEAGRMQATFRPIELPQHTAELASLFRAACEKAQIRLIVNCPSDALRGRSVFVDVDMWEKIVLNLLSNALKYTLKGEIEVRIEHNIATDRARLVVRDTGCGIPANELPRLFERFNRVQSSFGRTHEGTGIGLAFVYELVKLHGGNIQVTSAVGEGSIFSVYIPYGSAHLPSDSIAPSTSGPISTHPSNAWWLDTINPHIPARASSSTRSSVSTSTPAAAAASMHQADILMGDILHSDTGSLRRASTVGWTPARVLIADDNDDMLAYLCRILASSGLYEITEAHDGQEAIDQLLTMQPKPELVLSDIMMPRLGGYSLLKEIRAHPEISQIPVIFLSARAGEEARTEGMSAGADDYLAKPFSAKELLARVAARIELYRQHREATRREEKLRKNAEEANNVKDRFLAVLSHELRTPLTPALLLAEEYLLDRSISPSIAEDMAIISRQIRLQVQLIDDLLDVTKIRQGKLRLTLKPVDAHMWLRHTVAMFDRQLTEKHLRIDVQLQADRFVTPGDSTRLQQIYWNLLGNAIKFSHLDGRIVVRTWNNDSVAPPLLCVEVKDEGIGIEASALPKLFTAFEQTSQDVTRSFGGLGLGLVISKTLAILHGGSLQASSEGKNKGASFTLTLPTTVASPSVPSLAVAALDSARVPPVPSRPAQHLRLLLVEDNAVSIQVMERLLRRLGHEVVSAPSCERALKAATAHDAVFDVLLSDIGLPDGTGIELVRQLRPLQPKMRPIALSGYGREEDIKRCYKAGFVMHLTKPVRLAQLADAINQVMTADLR